VHYTTYCISYAARLRDIVTYASKENASEGLSGATLCFYIRKHEAESLLLDRKCDQLHETNVLFLEVSAWLYLRVKYHTSY